MCHQFHCKANPLALVDCVQDTYSNVAALIDDSVYNMEAGLEEDLEKMVLDLTRVDKRVTTIIAGVRSMSMTFKARPEEGKREGRTFLSLSMLLILWNAAQEYSS